MEQELSRTTAMITLPTLATGSAIRSISYTVPSATRAGVTYTVAVDPRDGRMTCSCAARVQCRHQFAVIAGTAGKPRVRISTRPLRG